MRSDAATEERYRSISARADAIGAEGAVDYAQGHTALLVVAAGNDGENIDK